MIVLALAAVLIGAILGLRFKILALVPAILFGSASTLSIGIAYGNGVWPVLLAVVLAVTMLQIGYLGGALANSAITVARVRKASPGNVAVQKSAH